MADNRLNPRWGDPAKYMTDSTGAVTGLLKPQTDQTRAPVPVWESTGKGLSSDDGLFVMPAAKALPELSKWNGSYETEVKAALRTQFGMPKICGTMKYRAGASITGVAQKYSGAVYSHRTGKVYFSPMTHTHFAVYDPVANTIDESFAAHGRTGTLYFVGGCLLDNGNIFAVPFDSAAACILDPTSASVTVGTGTLPGSSARFAGCAQAYTGDVICSPYNGATVVGRFSPTTGAYTAGPSTGGAGSFVGAAAHPNGNVYFSPLNASRVSWFDPDDNTWHDSSMAALTGTLKFQGCIVVPSGKIVMIPFSYSKIGVYDPATDTWAESSAHGKGSDAWNGGVLLGDGRVLMIPRAADYFGIFDPDSLTYSDGPTSAIWPAVHAFNGGALLPNGTLVAAPYSHTTVGLVDTFTIPMFPEHCAMHPAMQHY